jgi:CheY-like chemotaxis protein
MAIAKFEFSKQQMQPPPLRRLSNDIRMPPNSRSLYIPDRPTRPTRRIKADASLRSIPIIAVTSYALSGEEKKARAAGCDDYVPKPFSPRQLLAKVHQYLT